MELQYPTKKMEYYMLQSLLKKFFLNLWGFIYSIKNRIETTFPFRPK